jgi:hypothetical protein
MNEKIDKQGLPSFQEYRVPGHCQSRDFADSLAVQTRPITLQPPIGITGMPFTRNCVLDTMTLSPAFSPEEME